MPTLPEMAPRQAYQAFQAMRFGAMLVIGMVFAHAGMGTFDIGIYEGLIFFGSMLSFWWLSGITQALLSTPDRLHDGRSTAFFNVFVVLSLAGLLLFTVFRLSITPYSIVTNRPDLLAQYANYSWYLLLITPVFLIENILLLREKSRALLAYGVLAFGAQVLLTTLPILMGHGLDMAIQGLAISAFGRYVLLWVLLAKWGHFSLDGDYLLLFWRNAWPLVLAAILSGSGEYVDGLIVTSYFDEATFAIYRYGAKEFPLIMVLAAAFSNALVPDVGKLGMLATTANIKQGSTRFMHLFFPLSIGLMLVSGWAYPRFFNADFAACAPVFNTYLLLIIPRVLFPQTLLIGAGQSRTILWVSILEIALNIAISLALLPVFGLVGIALGTVVSSMIEKAVLLFGLRSSGIRPSQLVNVWLLAGYSCALLVAYGCSQMF